VAIPVQVAARRHDGTLPTGTLTLRDADSNTTVAQQPLDSSGGASFTITGLPAGPYNYTVDYSGDANFNAFSGAPASIYIHGYATTVAASTLPPFICAGTTLSFSGSVYASFAPSAPGSLTATIGATSYTLPLTPTGSSTSVANFTHTFTAADETLTLLYPGSGPYERSQRTVPLFVQPCQSMALVAQATSAGISVQWSAVAGAAYYEVFRYAAPTYYGIPPQWLNVRRQPETTWIDSAYGSAGAFLYSIRALDANGNTIAFSPPDLAVGPQFSDDPLIPGSTVVKSSHYSQLFNAYYALKRLAGDTNYYGGSPYVVGSPIRAADYANLRTSISNLRHLLGLPAFPFTTADPVKGNPIRAIDMQELRDAMK
jgi:hypothetical protein